LTMVFLLFCKTVQDYYNMLFSACQEENRFCEKCKNY